MQHFFFCKKIFLEGKKEKMGGRSGCQCDCPAMLCYLHEVPGVRTEGGGRTLEALDPLDRVVDWDEQLEDRLLRHNCTAQTPNNALKGGNVTFKNFTLQWLRKAFLKCFKTRANTAQTHGSRYISYNTTVADHRRHLERWWPTFGWRHDHGPTNVRAMVKIFHTGDTESLDQRCK